VVVEAVIACKVCGGASHIHGVVDFNKTCEAAKGRFFQLSGIPVWYHRCGSCALLFTAQFDHWTRDDWLREVYNAGYAIIDPDGVTQRPRDNAAIVAKLIRDSGATTVLDYGG